MPAPRRLLMLSLLAATACIGDRPESPAVSEQAAASGVEAFLRFGPVELGRTRAELRARLGEPDSLTRHTVANLHDPAVTDTVVMLHYPGVAAEIYLVSYDDRELLASLSITDNQRLRPESPLRIGMSVDEIRLGLGPPDRATGTLMVYECTTCGLGRHDSLELHLDGGRLRRIDVQYWID